jgi:hypothetical protein
LRKKRRPPWASPLKNLLLFAKTSVETAKNETRDHVDPGLLKNIDGLPYKILEETD